MDTGSPWFVFCAEQRKGHVPFRLFCFHYAGSGASVFRPWTRWLSDRVELVAVQLPGRENRLDEPLLHSMEQVTTPLAEALPPLLDRPFAFFGHSTGAVICFELARVLRRRALPQPRLLFVSGQNAPHIKPAVLRHRLSDPEFIEVLRGCRGTPDAVLQDPALLELLLPRIRADGAVYETYRYERQAPLECPIVVFRGLDDALVDALGLAAWTAETRHRVRRYDFPGGHFFPHEAAEAVVAHINHELEPFLGERTSSARRPS
jgi:surfactin synthase thioesterase subunit